ncbi:RING finger protein 17 [Arapaima gigas]
MASEENQMVRRKLRNLSVVNGPNSQGQVCQEWVFVTHVVNPNHFYVRRVAEKKAGALLSKKINSLCSEETALFTAHDVLQTGSTIFVRWKENAWCRAVLREVVRRGHGGPVTRCPAAAVSGVGVYFPDDGFSRQLSFPLHEDLDEDPFQQLNECLRKVDMAAQCELNYWAPQAVNCSLKDIVPPDQVSYKFRCFLPSRLVCVFSSSPPCLEFQIVDGAYMQAAWSASHWSCLQCPPIAWS